MKGIGFEYMYIHNRSGEMPLLLLCLLMCFYRDVLWTWQGWWKYDLGI